MKLFKAIKGKAKAAVLVLAAIALPLAGIVQAQSSQVLMEGNTQSLNVTSGETEYSNSTDAMVDDVVQVQVWLHNREMPQAENAKNTRVKVDVPSSQGKTQVITGTISADNANTVVDDTTLNLSLERARIEFMPGTAKYRYNAGAAEGRTECETGMEYAADSCFETITVSDDIVTNANGVNLSSYRGGDLVGCNAHHETVTIQVRVVADVVSVNKFVRHVGQGADDWSTSTNAVPGDRLEYLIRFRNEGNTELRDVMVGDNLPKYHSYVNGTTWLINTNNPSGRNLDNNNITRGGINVGHYGPGATGYVWFTSELDPLAGYERCNQTYDLRNVGVVRPAGMNEFYNTAQVLVKVDCAEEPEEPETQALQCTALQVSDLGDGKYRFTTLFGVSGGATQSAYVYNFGDGSNQLVTSNATVERTFEEGTFTVRSSVRGTVDGQTVTETSNACVQTVTFSVDEPDDPKDERPVTPERPDRPDQLPVTGPASVIGLFTATTFFSAAAHRFVTGRRQF